MQALSPASYVHGMLRSSARREFALGMVFTVSLVIAVAIWDGMTFHAEPVSWIGYAGIAVCAVLCALVLWFSQRRKPLLLCASVLISVRLLLAHIELAPTYGVLFIADCTVVCILFSTMLFRQEDASHRIPASASTATAGD